MLPTPSNFVHMLYRCYATYKVAGRNVVVRCGLSPAVVGGRKLRVRAPRRGCDVRLDARLHALVAHEGEALGWIVAPVRDLVLLFDQRRRATHLMSSVCYLLRKQK